MNDDVGRDDDLTKSAGEAASRRREASVYLQRIEEPTNRLKRRLALYSIAETSSVVLLIAVSISVFILDRRTELGAAALFLVLINEIFSRLKGALKSSIATIDEQVSDFKSERPPYETAEALGRLKERLDPLLLPRKGRRNGKIYISYLRTDAGYVGRLYDALNSHFGSSRIIMDVNSIPPGVDFVRVLQDMVEASSVKLGVIGPSWSTAFKEQDRGLPDFVKTEISLALSRDMLVIPVLVGNSAFPAFSEVPETIRPLLYRNALKINDARWRADVVRLTDELDRLVGR
jgi:hypothetical protein